MARLYPSAHVVAVLQAHGFIYIAQRGSHVKFRRDDADTVHTVIVPANRKEIPFGTFRSVVPQSGLSVEDFKK